MQRGISHKYINKAKFILSQLGIEHVVVGGELKIYRAMESKEKLKETERFAWETAYKSEELLRLLSLYLGSSER